MTSGICERYAFDSYYTVDMSGEVVAIEESMVLETIEAEESYDYGQENVSLIARIVATILIEMMIALLFGFRKKRELIFLAGVNVFTQVVLNVLLNVINYNAGQMAFVFAYVLLEIIVFVSEAVLYGKFMRNMSESPRKKSVYITYALVANVVSFVVGFQIAKVIPGIF